MKEALGNYMAMACNVDGLCLTDSSYNLVVENYPWVKDLAINYVQQHGQRVLNIALTGKKPRFIFTPFQANTSTCNPRILCGQLTEFANKNDLNCIIIPRPTNYDTIKTILQQELDDRFIVMVDDPKYLNIVEEEVDDGEDYPNLSDVFAAPNTNPSSTQVQTFGVCVTGHRLKDLYGYHAGDKWTALQNKMYACCEQLYNEYNVRRFCSGCDQGVDMSFFFCAQYLCTQHQEAQNILYRPFATHGSNFSPVGVFGQKDYQTMLSQASSIITVNKSTQLTSQEIVQSLLYRNKVMVDANDFVIGVYKGDKTLIANNVSARSGTLHALRYAYSQGKKIILINPETYQAERFNF